MRSGAAEAPFKGLHQNILTTIAMKGNYLFLADGFEISEALATIDMIRRGGICIKTVSIKEDDTVVTSSDGIPVVADMDWSGFAREAEAESTGEKDAAEGLMVFPGGMPGSVNLAGKKPLMELMIKHFTEGGLVAAICAAPSVVLHILPGIAGRSVCCYEGFEKALEDAGACVRKDRGVVRDGNVITSRGAGHAIQFGLEIVAAVKGRGTADRVAASIML